MEKGLTIFADRFQSVFEKTRKCSFVSLFKTFHSLMAGLHPPSGYLRIIFKNAV